MSENCAVILAAGEGTRMKSELPKALARVLFKPMLSWVADAVTGSGIDDLCIVAGYRHEKIEQYLNGAFPVVLQTERLGTGHAVKSAIDFIQAHSGGSVLVLAGDAPLVDSLTIAGALKEHTDKNNGVTVISAILDDPHGYGRIVRDINGNIEKIVEEKDATDNERTVKEINSGAYWFRCSLLIDALLKLTNNNAKGEYYLTDTIRIIKAGGSNAGVFAAASGDIVLGANTRLQLNELNEIARKRELEAHMLAGVDIPCTDGVIIASGAVIGNDTLILPGTVIKGGVTIGSGCTVGPNTVLEDCSVGNDTVLNNVTARDSRIGNGVTAGPYVQLRPGTIVSDGVHIGNFVEVKNSSVGEGTKLPHLQYIGDADVGKGVNIGCGCVTVNFTGRDKFRTTISDGAFIGCNTSLVAPVAVGRNAYTAAGSTITEDVPDDALAIARSRQVNKEKWVVIKKPYRDNH